MNDAEYIAAIAEFYKDGPSPEFRAHYERLMHISAAITAAPAQPRDDAVFVVWWSDHMPNSTEADAWVEWCALRSNQPTAQAQAAPVDADVRQDVKRLERERICAAIKAEDDYCVEHGDYMLDSDDCIKIVRGEWKRPDFAIAARAAERKP